MYNPGFDQGGDQSVQMARRKFSMPAPSFQQQQDPMVEPRGPGLAPPPMDAADSLPGDAPQVGGMAGGVGMGGQPQAMQGNGITTFAQGQQPGAPPRPPEQAEQQAPPSAPPRIRTTPSPVIGQSSPTPAAAGGPPGAMPPRHPMHGQIRPDSGTGQIALRAAGNMMHGGLIGAGASAVADYLQRRKLRHQGQGGGAGMPGPASPGPTSGDTRPMEYMG